MIELITSCIKYVFIILSSLYVFRKALKINISFINIIDIPISIGIAALTYVVSLGFKTLIPIVLLIGVFVYLLIRHKYDLFDTFSVSIISVSISFCLFLTCVFVSAPIFFIVYALVSNNIIKEICHFAIIGIVQYLFALLIFRFARINSKLNPSNKNSAFNFLVVLSSIILVIVSFVYIKDTPNIFIEIVTWFTILIGIILVLWWQKHLKSKYIESLYKRDSDLMKELLSEYQAKNENLQNEIAELDRIVHRDNKMLPIMKNTVTLLASNSETSEELSTLLSSLNELSNERNDAIKDYSANYISTPLTSNHSINAAIAYLEKKAKEFSVALNFSINADFLYLFKSYVSQTEFITLFCDLCENAIRSASFNSEGKVLVKIDTSNVPVLEIYDNGNHFDVSVIANWGKQKITTHKNSGGHGIGMLTCFKIVKNLKASFVLDEKISSSSYCKSIKILFDTQDKINILTDRQELILACKESGDFEFL